MKQNKQYVQMQNSKYKNKLRHGQNKQKSKQNKITDAPQPKPCSHGTNKRMQKQIQKQKTTASLVRMKAKTKRQKQNEICQCKFKLTTTNNTGHQTKQTKPLHLNNTDTYTPLSTVHTTTDHSPQHQEFKILLTPGVLKRNRLHLIG